MERVLEGMHKMAVADIAAEASVRKHVRELYTRYAVVSTGDTCMPIRAQPPFLASAVVQIICAWCTSPDIKLIVATLCMLTDPMHHLCMLRIFSVMTVCEHTSTSHVHGDDAALICHGTAAPTLSGEAVLTPFHPYGTVRHIQNKPVKKFSDRDQFLLIAAAEKEGLLKVQFKVNHVSKSGSVHGCG